MATQRSSSALSGGARLYAKTQKGEMPSMLKDLVRLSPETVSLWDGEHWIKVRRWLPLLPTRDRKEGQRIRSARYRGLSPVPGEYVEIKLRNGEHIGCTRNQQVLTLRGRVRASELRPSDVLVPVILPEPEEPVRPPGLPDQLTGWFVGLYVAEGSRSADTIQIASHVNEAKRFQLLRVLTHHYHGTLAIHRTGGSSCTANLNGPVLNALLDTYVDGNGARRKHLHVRCWQRSNDFLSALLEGYLGGDGHFDSKNRRWRLGFCDNEALAADLRTVGARLGIEVRLRRTHHVMNGRRFPGFRGELRAEKSHHHNAKPSLEVMAIHRSRARRFWGVDLEPSSSAFALTAGVLVVPVPGSRISAPNLVVKLPAGSAVLSAGSSGGRSLRPCR